MARPLTFLYKYRTLDTRGYHGHGIEFSPFDKDVLAVAGAENFGIKGSGSLILYNVSSMHPVIRKFNYIDAVFDLSWSKLKPDIIISGSGDGCMQIWSMHKAFQAPIACQKNHTKEVSSIEYTSFDVEYFTTSSWDSMIMLCDMNSQRPLHVFKGHQENMVYEAKWSRLRERSMASVSADGRTLIWCPFTNSTEQMTLQKVPGELLSCAWSHGNPNLLATASTDAVLYIWDLRFHTGPLQELRGHENAIRKVRFSPFSTNEISSVSYDFTTRLWDVSTGAQIAATQSHSEFVYGIDYCTLQPGIMADCSWDQTIQIYKIGGPPDPYSHNTPDENMNPNPSEPHLGSRPLPPTPSHGARRRDSYPPGARMKPLPPTPPRNQHKEPTMHEPRGPEMMASGSSPARQCNPPPLPSKENPSKHLPSLPEEG